MEQLKLTAAALCGTMVLSAVILFIAPQKDGRMLKFAVRVFFLLSIVLPLVGLDLSGLTIPETDVSDLGEGLEELAQRQLESAVTASLEAEADEILRDYGLSSARTEISIHNDPEDGISITDLVIQVSPDEADQAARAAPELNRTFGVTARLETEENQNGN